MKKLLDVLKAAGIVPETCTRAVIIARESGGDRLNYFDQGDAYDKAFDADVTITASDEDEVYG